MRPDERNVASRNHGKEKSTQKTEAEYSFETSMSNPGRLCQKPENLQRPRLKNLK
jgi:hypothetical protein